MQQRDFRAETIYFVVTDRFYNADPDNDAGDDPAGTDPSRTNWLRYWGGDLQGVIDKLDYLEALGISVLWTTPIFEQIDGLADDRGRLAAPYHGYWAKDYKRIDEHLLPRSEWHRPFSDWTTTFDRLLSEAHRRGIRVLLDVVCNHSSPEGPSVRKGELYDDGVWLTCYDDDRLGWYNRNGPIRDWSSPAELTKGELHGLADLNEDVWSFRHYITTTMKGWLARGADGFRIDAVKHMSLAFWQEFTATMRKERPGVILFGEWVGMAPWDARAVHFANRSGMSVLDWSLHEALRDVFCQRAHFRRLADVLHQDHVYDDATELVTFLDNHDMPRLLSVGLDPADLPLAIALLMTWRGVPCIFYGTEQSLHDDTGGGADPYNRPMMTRWDLDTPVAKILPVLSALRRRNLAVQRGFTREIKVEQDVFAYLRGYSDSAVLVIVNRGPSVTVRLEGLLLPDGDYRDVLGVVSEPVRVQGERIDALVLPSGAAVILEHSVALRQRRAMVVVSLNGYHSRYGERVVALGDAPELGGWDPLLGVPLQYVNGNLWMGDLAFDQSAGRDVLYRFAVIDPSGVIHHEDRLPRQRSVPREGVVSWKERWQG